MNSSEDRKTSLSDAHCAVQQNRAPRPLTLFLELVRMLSKTQPELAAKALEGLSRYEEAPRARPGRQRQALARVRGASLRDCGGAGAPVVLLPSLINPPDVLDLDEQVSLAQAIAGMGRHALLLDWGRARERSQLDLGGHIEELLLPLLREVGEPVALIGYCLGGTMAIAAANRLPLECLVTLAAPWRFSAYPEGARASLKQLWESSRTTAEQLGALPMEVLQAAFWSLDPRSTVAKFARFAEVDADSTEAHRFVTLEDWANEGEPLPCPAARELLEDMFDRDLPGNGEWRVDGKAVSDTLDVPLVNVTAANDRITPATAAPSGETLHVDAGHVGMIVGSARKQLHAVLAEVLRR